MYQDPIIAAYIDLIKAHTGAIKVFYQGEPIRIPGSNYPCAIISKRETRAGPLTNAEDEHGIAMTITVIADVRSDLSTVENIAEVVAGWPPSTTLSRGGTPITPLRPNPCCPFYGTT
jgi:hypothetical protein